jgi:hypothetical protein
MQTALATNAAPAPTFKWLRSPGFDLGFIFGCASIGLLAGAITATWPALFVTVFVLDMWLLGYHHVGATFTRTAFDAESLKANRFFVIWLPFIVLATTVTIALVFGAWTLATVYFYWQWLHYTRQSYGVARIYRRRAGDDMARVDWSENAVIYVVPLWGILSRSSQAPETFLNLPIRTLAVPPEIVEIAAIAAIVVVAVWAWRQVVAWREGRMAGAYVLYMLSHIVVFATGYVLIDDVNYGWLTINVWHNAQYIVLVWMANVNRFKAPEAKRDGFMAWLSREERWPTYFLVCFGISSAFYAVMQGTLTALGLTALTVTLIAYQTLNFHHYVVDSFIWKVRKPKLQAHFGIARQG